MNIISHFKGILDEEDKTFTLFLTYDMIVLIFITRKLIKFKKQRRIY